MSKTKTMLMRGLTVGAGCFLGSVIFNAAKGQAGRGVAIGLIAFALTFVFYGIRAVFTEDGESSR